MAVWNLIIDGCDNDTELETENDESTREIKRRRVYQRKDYKTSYIWFFVARSTGRRPVGPHTSRAARRHFIFKNVDAFNIPIKKKLNKKRSA